MTACPPAPPMVIDVVSISCANKWTYILVVVDILVWAILILAAYPAFYILPETGAVLHEFIATVIN